jgi:quinol monooxygenase YgiN
MVIIRVFRVQIDPAQRAAFERGFTTTSVQAVATARGCLGWELGWPTKWTPDTYVMISRWQNEGALAAFAGAAWNTPVIPDSMAQFVVSCSVEHYTQHYQQQQQQQKQQGAVEEGKTASVL